MNSGICFRLSAPNLKINALGLLLYFMANVIYVVFWFTILFWILIKVELHVVVAYHVFVW